MDVIVVGGAGPWLQPLVTLFVGLAAAAIAIGALLTNVAALHSAYRPVLRPVPAKGNDSLLLLKNIGRGPAVSIVLLDKKDLTRVAELDLVEPLGPRPSGATGEAQRVGRRELWIVAGTIKAGSAYRLLYQDIAGRWHETAFRRNQDLTLTVRYLGPRWRWRIPSNVRSSGQVTSASEFD